MSILADDSKKNVALFINDFDQEYADGLDKLSKTLARPLKGVILVDKKRHSKGLNVPDPRGIFEMIVCDYSQPESLHKALSKIEANLLLATFSSDYNAPYMQRLIPHMPYVLSPTESSLDWCTDKSLMRRMLESFDAGLVPKAVTIFSASDDEMESVKSLNFPVILKPIGLSSSMLVTKANSQAELKQQLNAGLKKLKETYNKYSGRGIPGFIVEEFIEAEMYSVDAYVNNYGQTWQLPFIHSKTAYHVGKEGFHIHQAETHHELSPEDLVEGQKVATKAIHALGLRNSVAHIELFHTANGWKVIELGPRAGGLRQDIYEQGYGIDHAYNELLIKIGLEPVISSEKTKHVNALYIFADIEGVIDGISGFDEAKAHPSVTRIDMKSKPGSFAKHSRNGGMAPVRAVVAHQNLEQLNKDSEQVRESIVIKIKGG